jgi:hypothetical protein
MKKIITLLVFLGITTAFGAQSQSKKNRICLRLGQQLVVPKPSSPPPKREESSSNPLEREGLYSKWKFIGFPADKEKRTKEILLKIKEKCPTHYLLACRGIREFHWVSNPNSPSWAYWPDKRVGLSMREYSWGGQSGGSLYTLAMLHEIQHCCPKGNEGEDGASWAAYYYGKKVGTPPFLLNWTRGLSLSMGYNKSKWNRQLRIAKTLNQKHIREGKYE